MEEVFSTSFAAVRVHVGPEAAALGAAAFAAGNQLYFAPGRYDPGSPRGQRLLAHELCHVVQQRSGRARNPFGSGVAVLCDPLLEAEADRMSCRAAAACESARSMPQVPRPVPRGLPLQPCLAARLPGPSRRAPPGTTVQPCWEGLKAWWKGTGKKKTSAAAFAPNYETASLLKEDALELTTCSTGAQNMVGALATGGALGSGDDVASLRTFMTGDGEAADHGTVIHLKVGTLRLSNHEFTVEQRGKNCQLYQAWADQIKLKQGLAQAKVQSVESLLVLFKGLEDSLKSGDSQAIKGQVTKVFGVAMSSKEWDKEQIKWIYHAYLSWTAYNRKS